METFAGSLSPYQGVECGASRLTGHRTAGLIVQIITHYITILLINCYNLDLFLLQTVAFVILTLNQRVQTSGYQELGWWRTLPGDSRDPSKK